jgi:hypothetical protein
MTMARWESPKLSKNPEWMKIEMEQNKIRQKEWEEQHRREQEELERRVKHWAQQRRLEEIQEDSVGFFLKEESGFTYDLSSSISSRELYEIYCTWCRKERVVPEGLRALSWRLKHRKTFYPVRETILTRDGRRCRGFAGIRPVTDDTDKE